MPILEAASLPFQVEYNGAATGNQDQGPRIGAFTAASTPLEDNRQRRQRRTCNAGFAALPGNLENNDDEHVQDVSLPGQIVKS
jgi:hypothetical protein